jgi:TonB family protein
MADFSRTEMEKLIELYYPPRLRLERIEGNAVVEFIAGPNGTVWANSVKVVSATHPALGDASVQVILRMHFNPAKVGDQNVPMLLQLPVTWKLSR